MWFSTNILEWFFLFLFGFHLQWNAATAKNKSVVGNFDLSYLQKNLKENFIEINQEERCNLKEEFERKTKGYNSLNIQSNLINVEDDIELELEQLFKDEEDVNELFVELSTVKDFAQKRYIRVAKAFDEFIKTDDIKSMICFLNAFGLWLLKGLLFWGEEEWCAVG